MRELSVERSRLKSEIIDKVCGLVDVNLTVINVKGFESEQLDNLGEASEANFESV
jgi:hypothetical protein